MIGKGSKIFMSLIINLLSNLSDPFVDFLYLITVRIHLFGIEQSEMMSQLIRRHLVVQPVVGHRNVLTHVRAKRNAENRKLKTEI
jgi:hypothetical protein